MTMHNHKAQPSTWERTATLTPDMLRTLQVRRRALGVLLGAGLGLSYGLVAQLVNRVALPGVPLNQPPLGWLGNIVLYSLAGAGLGFISTQPASAALGILFGSLAAAMAVFVSTLLRLGSIINAGSAFITSIVFSVPIAWLIVPLVALLRWVTDRQVETERDQAPLLTRLRMPLALVLIMAILAAFELLPANARVQLKHTHTLMQAGLQASTANNLPAPLRGPLVTRFPPNAGQDYTLEWTTYDLDRFIELRPSSNYDQHAAVIARFAGGYSLVCLYPTPRSEPACGVY